MSEKQNYPEFYQPTESTNTPEAYEQEKAARLFNEIFDDFMLRYMAKAKHNDILGPEISLRIPIIHDGQKYSLEFEDSEVPGDADVSPFRDSEVVSRVMSVEVKDDDWRGHESWDYQLGKDGVVRRYDKGNKRHKSLERQDYYSGDIDKLLEDEFNELTDISKNILPNRRLAEDAGVNHQPVTLVEIQGFKEFLDSAEVLSRRI